MPDAPNSGRYLGLTLSDALGAMTAAFAKANIETPAVDARILVPAALGLTKQQALTAPERRISEREAQLLYSFEHRRLAHEPVSRILQKREFYGRSFLVTPQTLDPRPDTETLVDAALDAVRQAPGRRPLRILDIGTGTGCLLLTLLLELEGSTGVGRDVSEGALQTAMANAKTLGLEKRATFEVERSAENRAEAFDVIVSNPPYIGSSEIETLAPDVRLYDPHVALDGGHDGFDVYREIAEGLASGPAFSWLFLEVGAGQADDVSVILKGALKGRISRLWTTSDLSGHTRCVALQTHS